MTITPELLRRQALDIFESSPTFTNTAVSHLLAAANELERTPSRTQVHIGDGITPNLKTRAVDITISEPDTGSITFERKRTPDGGSEVTILQRNARWEPAVEFTFDHRWWVQIVDRMEQL